MKDRKKIKSKSAAISSETNLFSSPAEKKSRMMFGLIVGVIGFLLYTNTLNNGYVLDDFSAIKENNIVRQGISAIPEIFQTSYRQGYLSVKDGLYRPLSLAMFALEWHFFPDQPAISHFVNILLYGITGFILFLTLCKLFQGLSDFTDRTNAETVAFVSSLLFIAHPIHVEVVANIKSRDEILCFLFSVFSLWFMLRYHDEQKKRFILISSGCLFLAFLSKETAITWLAVLPISLHFFRKISIIKNVLLLLPFLLTTGIYLFIRSSVLQGELADSSVSMADNVVSAAKSASTRLGTAFYILGLYIIKLFFPHPLSYDYSFNHISLVEITNAFSILAFLFYAGIGSYAVMILRKTLIRQKVTSYQIQIAFGILFFLVTIFLFSNLVLIIGTSMGDRLMYFPSLGFCLVIGALYVKFIMRNSLTFSAENVTVYPIILILLLFSLKTWTRNYDWKDNYTLYSHDVKLVPNSAKAHYYLGLELVKEVANNETDPEKKKKIYEDGIAELQKAVEILPAFGNAYTQMGVAYYRMKNYEKAIESYNKAAELNPQDAITLNNIGTVYFEWKKYDKAKEKFEQALKIDNRFIDAHMNLGSALATMGDFKRAIASFQNAVHYAPDNAHAHYFLALTYLNMQDKNNANKHFQIAERLNPRLKRPQ